MLAIVAWYLHYAIVFAFFVASVKKRTIIHWNNIQLRQANGCRNLEIFLNNIGPNIVLCVASRYPTPSSQ